MKKLVKKVLLAFVVTLVLLAGACAWYVGDYYHVRVDQLVAAQASLGPTAAAQPVAETEGAISVGSPQAPKGIVFYPGAKVESAAYVPLAQRLAGEGYYCVIVKMPAHLAMFDIDAASGVMAANPDVGEWWIAGHSLGGAMAAEYARDAAGSLRGIVFLAAYPAADLSGTQLTALTIYGSEDGVLNRDKLSANEKNLPSGSRTVVIEGGNHAGFGDYGAQAGDGEATIGPDEQQEQAARAIADFIG